MKTLHLIASLVCAIALTACGAVDNTTAIVIDPTTQPTGYSATDTVVGTGTAVVAAKDQITVNYSLWLYSTTATDHKGKLIQTSTSPFFFVVGTGSVIAGFDQGVIGMKVGGKRELILPYSLGYGSTAVYDTSVTPNVVQIPAYSGLVYDIELVTLVKGS